MKPRKRSAERESLLILFGKFLIGIFWVFVDIIHVIISGIWSLLKQLFDVVFRPKIPDLKNFAGCLILTEINGEKYLLLQQRKNELGGFKITPGGYVKEGESSIEAAVRYLQKKTNIREYKIGKSITTFKDKSRTTNHIFLYAGSHILMIPESEELQEFNPRTTALCNRECGAECRKSCIPHIIRAGFGYAWVPLEFLKKKTIYSGISSEVLREI